MKKSILKIIICLAISYNNYAQEGLEVPLGSLSDEYSSGVYLKDFDEILTPYVGAWTGTINNKKYIFVIQKFEKHLISYPNYHYYRDKLKIKFSVTDLTTNNIIYSSLNAVNYDDYPIYGVSKPFHGSYEFVFKDSDSNCQNTLLFFLDVIAGQPEQLKYCKFQYDEWWLDKNCTNYSSRDAIPVFLPKVDFILTKQ